jgi:hypothetical protein
MIALSQFFFQKDKEKKSDSQAKLSKKKERDVSDP